MMNKFERFVERFMLVTVMLFMAVALGGVVIALAMLIIKEIVSMVVG